MAMNLSKLSENARSFHQKRVPQDLELRLEELRKKMKKAIGLFLFGLLFALILLIIFTIALYIQPNVSKTWYWMTIGLFSVNSFIYILFRESRTHLMYYVGISDKWKYKYIETYRSEDDKQNKLDLIKINEDEQAYSTHALIGLKFIGKLSNHIFYLKTLAYSFIFLTIIIVPLSLFSVSFLNPIVYLLYFFTAIIYLSSIIVQHFIYYTQGIKDLSILDLWQGVYEKENKSQTTDEFKLTSKLNSETFYERRKQFLRWAPIFIIVLSSIATYSVVVNNDLHEFEILPEDKNTTSLSQFQNNFLLKNSDDLNPCRKTFSIASFGGGLKANYWTLNLLNKFENKFSSNFFNATISMSGVSGGAIGLGCYPFLYGTLPEERRKTIDDIGDLNILSIDVSYLLFQDYLRELIPWNISGHPGSDRSHKAMEAYHKLLSPNNPNIHDITFKEQWHEIYKKNSHYPALIINTTSTNRSYGYAPSLSDVRLPGGINIVDYPNKESISYFNAVSTANRFAFMSPAAAVPKKGHFVDGGYFENSGLLSTESFLKQFFNTGLEKKLKQFEDDHFKICMINGKGYWIRHLLNQNSTAGNLFTISDETQSAEIPAILKTVAGTDMLPTYFIEDLENRKPNRFIPIYMPLLFNIQDVENVLGGKIKHENRNTIIKIIKENNKEIKSALVKANSNYSYEDWGIVQPTLARMLSKPDREYQKAMVDYHPHVQEQFIKVDSLIYHY